MMRNNFLEWRIHLFRPNEQHPKTVYIELCRLCGFHFYKICLHRQREYDWMGFSYSKHVYSPSLIYILVSSFDRSEMGSSMTLMVWKDSWKDICLSEIKNELNSKIDSLLKICFTFPGMGISSELSCRFPTNCDCFIPKRWSSLNVIPLFTLYDGLSENLWNSLIELQKNLSS